MEKISLEKCSCKRGASANSTGKSPACPHDGHRDRLRNRFWRTGLDDFAPHEVIELLLTTYIPRGDVNGQAHALIERFGSVAGVLEASPADLQSIDGIGPKTAFALSLLPSVFRYYDTDRVPTGEPMDTLAKIGEFLHARYIGVKHERVLFLLFDNSMRLIDCTNMGDGAVNCTQVTVRCMVARALHLDASAAVLAHNHPRGIAVPSSADREVTENLAQALDLVSIPLLEHIIVTENSYAPIMRNQKGILRASPSSEKPDESFYLAFYGEEPAP